MEINPNPDLPSPSFRVKETRGIRIYEHPYHGHEVKIIELEHGAEDQGKITSTDFIRPPDWKDQLTQRLKQNADSMLFPEYCIPDFYRRVFSELGTKDYAKETFKKIGTTEFYSHISKFAGVSGVPLFAADIANTNMYEVHDIPFAYLNPNPEVHPDQILEFEKTKSFSNIYDARHLILARGIMQEILRSDKSVLHINAPVHGIRVSHYINEQIDWENGSGVKIENPIDFKYVSPELAIQKMKKYKRYFGLDVSVRKYVPILPPIAYEIDMLANDPKLETENRTLGPLLDEYLSTRPTSKRAKKVFRAIEDYRLALESKNGQEIANSAGRILTDKFGWKLEKVEKIY
jgi:hypothetical protein